MNPPVLFLFVDKRSHAAESVGSGLDGTTVRDIFKVTVLPRFPLLDIIVYVDRVVGVGLAILTPTVIYTIRSIALTTTSTKGVIAPGLGIVAISAPVGNCSTSPTGCVPWSRLRPEDRRDLMTSSRKGSILMALVYTLTVSLIFTPGRVAAIVRPIVQGVATDIVTMVKTDSEGVVSYHTTSVTVVTVCFRTIPLLSICQDILVTNEQVLATATWRGD